MSARRKTGTRVVPRIFMLRPYLVRGGAFFTVKVRLYTEQAASLLARLALYKRHKQV